MVSALGMTNSCKCPPALTDSDSRYYSCSDETSRSGFQRPACFLCAGAGVAPGAAGTLRGTGGFKDQNGKDCVFGLALWNRSFFRAPLESPQKLQYLLFGPAAVVAIGIGQE